MKKLLLLSILTSLINAKDIDATYKNIIEFQKKGIVIDIRNPEEWEETGVIPNAKTVTFFSKNGQISESIFIAKLKNYRIEYLKKPIALICLDGTRSKKAQELLHNKMKVDVINLTGGYQNISNHKGE